MLNIQTALFLTLSSAANVIQKLVNVQIFVLQIIDALVAVFEGDVFFVGEWTVVSLVIAGSLALEVKRLLNDGLDTLGATRTSLIGRFLFAVNAVDKAVLNLSLAFVALEE